MNNSHFCLAILGILVLTPCEGIECPVGWTQYQEACFILKGPLTRKESVNECKINLNASVMKPMIQENADEILEQVNPAEEEIWLDVKRNRADNIYRWDSGNGNKVIQSDGTPLSSGTNSCVKYWNGMFIKVKCRSTLGHIVCTLGDIPTKAPCKLQCAKVEQMEIDVEDLTSKIGILDHKLNITKISQQLAAMEEKDENMHMVHIALKEKLNMLEILINSTVDSVEQLEMENDILRKNISDLRDKISNDESMGQIDFRDCEDVKTILGSNYSEGVHEIYIDSVKYDAYCDSDGYTVIQSRGRFRNPSDYFYRGWDEYLNPFGTAGTIPCFSRPSLACKILKICAVLNFS